MLLGASTREVELATITISDVNRKFSMPVEVTKVDKEELLFMENPKYQEVIARNPHLSGVVMNDVDTKSRLPVHIILGAGDFAKLKTESVPKIGEPGQPVAELEHQELTSQYAEERRICRESRRVLSQWPRILHTTQTCRESHSRINETANCVRRLGKSLQQCPVTKRLFVYWPTPSEQTLERASKRAL